MRVHSFGDSFTQGLGVDRKVEEKFFTDNPNDKTKARKLLRKFHNKHSYPKLFADMLEVPFINHGEAGCNNKRIISNIFDNYAAGRISKGDLVTVAFTSTLRDYLPFMPDIQHKSWCGVTWSIKELVDLHKDFGTKEDYLEQEDENLLQGLTLTKPNKEFSYFFRTFSKFFVSNMFEFRYLDFFNFNIILLLQRFFEQIEVDYILIDAFELSYNSSDYDKTHLVNKDKYWMFGKHSIHSYLKTFNNRDLFELDGYNIPSKYISLHPSAAGHKVFAKELYRFYKEK